MSVGDSTRKPSGSSTHSSTAHSPTTTPSTGQRKITPTSTGSMLTVNMSAANSLKSINPGWQVWAGGSPSSKRKPSNSSATSTNDLSTYSESPYYAEAWSSPSRPASGNWDDVTDVSQLGESQSPLNLHTGRQRPAQPGPYPGQRMDDLSPSSKTGQYSPQRYDTSIPGKEASARYGNSSTKAFSSGTASVDTELSLALRGMAVEDDYSARATQPQGAPQTAPMSSSHSTLRSQPPASQPSRAQYGGGFIQDYSTYYSNPSGRDPYVDYSYYDQYRGSVDPGVYASPVMSTATPAGIYPAVTPQSMHMGGLADMPRPQFYDFSGNRPPASQYFYPAQAVMYPPTLNTPTVPNTGDKKRDTGPYQQQRMTSATHTDTRSSHHHSYSASLDYSSRLSMVQSGGMYGPNPQAVHVYPHVLRPGRRDGPDHPTLALRSPLLDEFRVNKNRKWELRDIFGYIVEFSGDQHGSRFIQQKLESATTEEKQAVFDEIVPGNALQLIQDVFGNYVIQKLFEHGTQVHKTLLANTMEGHILPLSLQMYGCRVVQKAVEFILPDQQGAFVKELEGQVLKCVKDANGNHVIQKIIERVSADRLGFVNAFRGKVYELASHAYGCRVLQRCLEHLPDDLTRPLLEELHQFSLDLMQDQFGNYVIQFVLEHGQPADRNLVIQSLRGQLLAMAKHKFASNVCEKALICADSESRRLLIDEIMFPSHDGIVPVVMMMKDQYANYVLQRALGVVEGNQKDALINLVRTQLVEMRRVSTTYTKHLIAVERKLEQHASPSHYDQPLGISGLSPP